MEQTITREQAWQELVKAISGTDDPVFLDAFLKSILTDYEIDEVSKRWALVRLLDQGVSQRNIARILGLSLCKITRGSKELKKKDSPFARMIRMFKT